MTTKRRTRRAPVTINQDGDNLAGMGSAGLGTTVDPQTFGWVATSDPDIIKHLVSNGTPTEAGVTAVSVDFPVPGYSTWYKPTAGAYAAGRANAAIETISATVDNAIDIGGKIASNIVPILIGLAVLFFAMNDRGR